MLLIAFALTAGYLPQAKAGGKGPAAPQLGVSPSVQGAYVPYTTFTYAVKVTLIPPFNGWDVELAVDQGALNPISVNTTLNLFTVTFGFAITTIANCVNGGFGIPFGMPGNIGCGVTDGPGIAHSAAVISGPPPSTKPMSGLLFIVTYQALYGTSSTVHIQNDLISNGGGTPVAHTDGDGQYGAPADFGISATVPTVPLSGLPGGSSGTTNITLTSLLGFSGPVSLSTSISPSIVNPLTATLKSSSLTVPAHGSVQTTLTLSTTGTTLNGTYTVTVTGKSPTSTWIAASVNVAALVTASADLTIAASPTVVTIAPGTTQTSTIALHSVNGFAGSLTPTVTVAPKGPTAKLSPSTITLTAGGTGSATLSVTAGTSLANGTYTATVSIPVSRTVVRSVSIAVVEPGDFRIAASPARLSIVGGGSDTSTITITSVNGFTGTVTLATSGIARGGPAVSLGASSFTLAAGGSATTTLTVATAVGTVGTFTVVLTGTSSPLKHSQTVGLTIVATADFVIHDTPGTLEFVASNSGTTTINIDRFGLNAAVSLSFTGTTPAGLMIVFAPPSVTLSSANPDPTSTLTVFTTASTPSGTYSFSIIGTSGALSHSVPLVVIVDPDFTISAGTPTLTATSGTAFTGSSSITLSSLGFTGPVNLSRIISPTVVNGPTAVLNQASVSLTPGSTDSTTTVTVSTSTLTPAGTYHIFVNGIDNSGVLSHTATVTLIVS